MKRLIAIVFCVLTFFISGYFLFRMNDLNILPVTKYLIVFGVVCAIFALQLALTKRKNFTQLSILLSVILLGIYAYLSYSLTISKQTLDKVTGASDALVNTKDYVSVLVLSDHSDDVKTLNNTTVGLDISVEASLTTSAFNQFKKDNSLKLKATSDKDITSIINGLFDATYSAIFIDSSRVALMDDICEGFSERTKAIAELEVNVSKQTTPNKPTKKPAQDKPAESFSSSTEKTDSSSADNTLPITERPFIVYISGIDTKGPVNVKSRSDTNILMCIDPVKGKILMVSTPRDTYLPLYKVSGDVKDKLTHAGLYGVSCSIGTLESLYDISIDYYVRVNFTSVETIVDALGGVSVYSALEFDSRNILGYHFNQGMNEVNGEQALVFCRERYSFSDGDFQRGRNHIEMIKAVFNKCTSPQIIIKLPELLAALSESFQTNMTSDELTSLIRYQIDNNISFDFDSVALNNNGGFSNTCYSLAGPSLYVGFIDEGSLKNVKSAINSFLNK